MKRFLLIAWLVFFFGIIFKLFHIPGANIVTILGTFLLLLHSLIFLFKHYKSQLNEALLYLSFSSITLYVLIRLMHWPGGFKILGFYIIFIIPFGIAVLYFSRLKGYRDWIKKQHIILLIYFVFFVRLSFTHACDIYYFFNIQPVLNGPPKVISPAIYDTYSWFLYLANNKLEALEANQKAAESAKQIFNHPEEADQLNSTLRILNSHRDKILTNTWEQYAFSENYNEQ